MSVEVVAEVEDSHRRVRGPDHIPRVQRASGLETIGLYGAGAGQDHVRSVFFRYLGQWFSGLMGVPVAVFRKQFATQSNRSGGASAALNAGVSDELIGQQGNRKTKAAQRRYMKSVSPRLLSVSRAAMGLPKTPVPDVRIEDESAGVPPVMAEDDLLPDVIGVPPEAFAWS